MFSPKLLVLVVIITLIGALFYFRSPATDSSLANVQVTSHSIDDSSAAINYQIKVNYPQITGLTDTQTEAQVNTNLANLANSLVTSFKQQIDHAPPPNLPASLADQPDTLNVTYNVAQANAKFVSVQFEISAMEVGMAHPNNYNQTFNYSLAQNRVLTLDTIFKPGSNYLSTLSQLTAADLTKQFADQPSAAYFISAGTAPQIENFRNFLITPDSLIIIFDPAQVAPNSAGTITVTLPFSQLPDLSL